MRIPLLGRLMALLIVVPLLDMGSIILMSHYVGGWATFGTVLICGILGAVLVKREWTRTWNQFRYEIAKGQIPETPLLDGLLVFASGILLMTPGPLTDTLGLVLLLPPVRNVVRLAARQRVEKMLMSGALTVAQRATVHRVDR